MQPKSTSRLNKFIADSTGMSRRAADSAIDEKRVRVNGAFPEQGMRVTESDNVTLDGQPIAPLETKTIMFNKPAGYIVSRDGQGSDTIYDILPKKFQHLKPVGRLDKDSSGLLLLTNDGALAQELTHPRHQKTKIYHIELSAPLAPLHRQMISDMGIQLEDGPSRLILDRTQEGNERAWTVTMHEGRNRQIRRTFEALGYRVTSLHRIQFGPYRLNDLQLGKFTDV